MRRLKSIFICLAFVSGGQLLHGQQLSQFSQYLHNPILLNPATAGINNNINMKLSYRNQWTGFTNAPESYYFSVDGTLGGDVKGNTLSSSRRGYTEVKKSKKTIGHGVGAYVLVDSYGAFTNTSGYLTYALHLSITESIKLSLGLAAGMSGWKLNSDRVQVADPNDATFDYLMALGLKKTFFDMNSGLWVYSDKFYVGYSSEQLLQNQLRNIDIPAETKISIHHYVTGGYVFYINPDLSLTPSLMVKYMRPAPTSMDLNVKANYKEHLWGGVSYRTNDAVVIIVGYNIKYKYNIGYSYDVTLSELKKYSSGSHEIVLGYKFYKDKKRSTISFL